MKGKKADAEFVAEFIEQSLKDGIFQQNDIVNSAKNKILEIENKIIEVEKLKAIRSKLLDVVEFLELKEKKEVKIFTITNYNLCNNICNLTTDNLYKLFMLNRALNYPKDFDHAIEELIKNKILKKVGSSVCSGSNMQNYKNFANMEINEKNRQT